jgi:hypothetical protein
VCLVSCAAVIGVSVTKLARLDDAVERSRIRDGVDRVRVRLVALSTAGTTWPWPRFWPQGDLPDAIWYLNRCVAPGDRILLTWSAPEYYYFSSRGFGAGIALFLPPRAFTTAVDQAKMRQRLERQYVPLVLINETRRGEFALAYPEIDRYVRERYLAAATFVIRDGSIITIAARNDLQPRTVFGEGKWPCGFESRVAPSRR